MTRPLAPLAIILLLAACTTGQAAPTLPAAVPSATASATVTPPPIATLTPFPSPTHPPTPTPTYVLSPTPPNSPTPTPVLTVERGTLAPGFSLTVYAKVPSPTSLAFGPDGRLYVSAVHTPADIAETVAAFDRAFSAVAATP